MLSKALEEVCRSRVTIGMYPMCALNLVIPPASVNVNVHPNKLEVRFKDDITMRQVAERLMATAFEGERVLEDTQITLAIYVSPGEVPQESPAAENDNTN